jgi:hypothetical protein
VPTTKHGRISVRSHCSAPDASYCGDQMGRLPDHRKRSQHLALLATTRDSAPEKPEPSAQHSADFVRCYRNGGNGLGSMVVYGYPCQPTGEPNDYEISKVAIHH